MTLRQEKLVRFVRELHKRDQVGPGSFPILPSESVTETTIERTFRPQGVTRSGDILSLKQAESAKRGFTLDGKISPPGPAAIRGPVSLKPALTEQAANAFDRVLNNKPVSDADLIHLESIVLPTLRPVFDIQNETYATLPASWDPFNQKRDAIEPLIRGIGRLQLTGHPSYTLVGTGFVCGANIVLTNRHVAQIFVEGVQNGPHASHGVLKAGQS